MDMQLGVGETGWTTVRHLGGDVLANDYGYWVSADLARDTGRTPGEMGKVDPPARAKWGLFGMTLAGLAGGGVCFGAQDSMASGVLVLVIMFSLMLFMGGVLGLFGTVMLASGPLRNLETKPWQAWPCRIDGKPPTRGTFSATVTLLDPERRPVARYRGSSVPVATWHRMEDGYGVLWVCGDLRTPLVFADPGGSPVWFMSPVDDRTSPAPPAARGLGDAAADEAVRQAGAAVTDAWLQSFGL